MNTVNQYRESIDKLPPLLVDRKNRLVDGYHRLLAYRQEQVEEVEAELFDSEDDRECELESIRRNSTHGRQLTSMEKKRHALNLYGLKVAEDLILKVLSISERTYRDYTKATRKEEDDARDEQILKLYLSCHTEQEIAEEVGLSREGVDHIIQKFGTNGDIAKSTTEPPSSLQVSNLWSFESCDPAFGVGYAGRMPGQIVQNLLWYYTKPFDIVLDPFAGGGTTVDVCLSMYRRYLAYDLNPIEAKGIQKWDILEGLPRWRVKGNPALILLDPPYADQKKGEYTLSENDLSNLSHDVFREKMFRIVNDCASKLDPNGTIALIISASKKQNIVTDWGLIFGSNPPTEFRLTERIIVPYENATSMTGFWIENAKENKQMLRTYRDLLIFQRAR